MILIVKFVDLQAQYKQYKSEIDAAIRRVLDHSQYINGPEVTELEVQLAQYTGASHCIGTSSGTMALQIALMALDVGLGDEVITTPFSFFATVEVIFLLGARPVYVDIDPKTFNIDPNAIEAVITEKTKAILPVSLFGQPADFDRINAVAFQYGLPVIEDAAQSLGAVYKGRRSGNLSTIACTSFFPSKPLGCYGDAGACFTNDLDLAIKIRRIAHHGEVGRYHHKMLGLNGRIDTIQAAILLEKLKWFDKEVMLRQKVAQEYSSYLSDDICLPYIKPFNKSVYGQYTIQVNQRDQVQALLKENGVPTAVHYPRGLHQQPAAQDLEKRATTFPVTERVATHVLSLPFYPSIPVETIAMVADQVNIAVKKLREQECLEGKQECLEGKQV